VPSDIYLAIDAFRLVSEPHTSGAFVVSEIVRELQHRPEIKKITLLLPRKPDNEFLFKDLLVIEKVDILVPEKEYFPERNFRGNIKWIQFVIPQLLGDVRITHLISPYHQAPVFLRRQIKVITIICDMCGVLPSAGYYYHKKGPYRHWFNFTTALWRSNAFVYISEYTKDVFEQMFPSVKKKISVVIYPKPTISGLPTSADIEDVLNGVGLVARDYFFAFGSGGIRKGADLTIKAFALYQEQGGSKKLVLLAPDSAQGYIKESTPDGLKNIIVLSKLSNAERDAIYAGAVALVFPSRCEGFGYPILEAMYQGCPPIALENSPAREIIENCVSTLKALDLDEIVDLMFVYERQEMEGLQKLNPALKSRALEFIAQMNTSKHYTELFQSIQ